MASTYVMHRGALGDAVLLWPYLRALARRGEAVTLVSDGAKARLAAAELCIACSDAEQPRFNDLFVAHAPPTTTALPDVTRVVTFLVDPKTATGRVWLANARLLFPRAALTVESRELDRRLALELAAGVGAPHEPEPRSNPRGAAVLHAGAGSRAKRWPLDRFEALAARLAVRGVPVRWIAGEVEAELFDASERSCFAAQGGVFLRDLDALAAELRAARVVVAADSGPAHLAAQLGVATVALFGPTDPARWSPLGPRVAVLAPPRAMSMDWLEVEKVGEAVESIL